MNRSAIVIAFAAGSAVLLADRFSEGGGPSAIAGLIHDHGVRSAESEPSWTARLVATRSPVVGASGSDSGNHEIRLANRYDDEFLALIRVEARLSTAAQARTFVRTLEHLSQMTGRDPRAVLLGLEMKEPRRAPSYAGADRYFYEHSPGEHSSEEDGAASAALGLELGILNEIWRFSPWLHASPTQVEVQCRVHVCRAMLAFPPGSRDVVTDLAFGLVETALELELDEHGITAVTPGLADMASGVRKIFLWRQPVSDPDWDAFLPTFMADSGANWR